MLIKKIKAREILDSRGNPTIEVDLTTKDGLLNAYNNIESAVSGPTPFKERNVSRNSFVSFFSCILHNF